MCATTFLRYAIQQAIPSTTPNNTSIANTTTTSNTTSTNKTINQECGTSVLHETVRSTQIHDKSSLTTKQYTTDTMDSNVSEVYGECMMYAYVCNTVTIGRDTLSHCTCTLHKSIEVYIASTCTAAYTACTSCPAFAASVYVQQAKLLVQTLQTL
jgi:hypothetical protein